MVRQCLLRTMRRSRVAKPNLQSTAFAAHELRKIFVPNDYRTVLLPMGCKTPAFHFSYFFQISNKPMEVVVTFVRNLRRISGFGTGYRDCLR